MFLVIVQLKVSLNTSTTLIFESVKSTLASGLWLWLMLDSAFGPWQRRWSNPEQREEEKVQRLARAATCVILLL